MVGLCYQAPFFYLTLFLTLILIILLILQRFISDFMFYLIGLGLFDEKDISLKGLETLKDADKVYAEFFTSRLFGSSFDKIE